MTFSRINLFGRGVAISLVLGSLLAQPVAAVSIFSIRQRLRKPTM